MINAALTFLKNHLNEHLNLQSAVSDSIEDKAAFVNIAADGAISFREGAVTALLINTEEDRTIRPPDPYRVRGANGIHRRVQPEVAMHLYVLFVARFNDYTQSLDYISRVIRHFQINRVLTSQNAPTLHPQIGQLTMELHSLTMQQQNDMWNMLKVGYQPSVLYRSTMIAFRDDGVLALPVVNQITRSVVQPSTGPRLLKSASYGAKDDLERISGVGPALALLLNRIGVYYFWQVASWDADDVQAVDDLLESFKGRIIRDQWVQQARMLMEEPPPAPSASSPASSASTASSSPESPPN